VTRCHNKNGEDDMKKKILYPLLAVITLMLNMPVKAKGALSCEAIFAACMLIAGPDPVAWAGCSVYYALCSIFG